MQPTSVWWNFLCKDGYISVLVRRYEKEWGLMWNKYIIQGLLISTSLNLKDGCHGSAIHLPPLSSFPFLCINSNIILPYLIYPQCQANHLTWLESNWGSFQRSLFVDAKLRWMCWETKNDNIKEEEANLLPGTTERKLPIQIKETTAFTSRGEWVFQSLKPARSLKQMKEAFWSFGRVYAA